jgi:hypothetical protein
VVTITLLLIYSLTTRLNFILSAALAFFIYYLVTLFVLTLLMVLKRTHVLLSTET